jgi:hypothetical protein
MKTSYIYVLYATYENSHHIITCNIVQLLTFFTRFDEYAEMHKTEKWLQAKGIKLRYIQSHDGYIVHYNCDSVPFLKKVIDDTIKNMDRGWKLCYGCFRRGSNTFPETISVKAHTSMQFFRTVE